MGLPFFAFWFVTSDGVFFLICVFRVLRHVSRRVSTGRRRGVCGRANARPAAI
ncbi:hypothetical protein CAPI_01660 [Corynebacterium capitovis DSM 44611]|nr:hypothetical protein CAPI_01660 [Corynebacterium capitovis DSM 44611]